MLSLSTYPYYNTPFCRADHGVSGVQKPLQFPVTNSSPFSNWLVAEPVEVRTSESEQPNSDSSKVQHHERDTTSSEPHQRARLSPRSVGQGAASCPRYPSPMNGENDLIMTGSSNPRSEQLSWLAEVATSNVRTAQSSSPASPGHEKVGPQLLHNSECHPQRSSLNSILLGNVNQRLYAPYPPERFHPGHQTSGGSGNRLSLYYTQAPRTTPYQGFYPPDHRLPYDPVVTEAMLAQRRLPHPYYQNELYSSAITNVQIPSAHSSLPHSPSYLHPSASLSPGGLSSSPSSPRMPQTSNPMIVSRSSEGLSAHEHDKSNLTIQAACNSPHYHRRKSYKSPEPKNISPPMDNISSSSFVTDVSTNKDASLRQNTSPPQIAYKVPTGKEGSLKHRILRPPSINIVDPPSTVLEAPLSAPPIRSHREPSPKQLKPETYPSYLPFSPSGAYVIEGSQLLAQQPVAAPSFLVPVSAPSHSLAVSAPDPGSQLKYPRAFMKGSIIQLANSQLKPVELMTTEDFFDCETFSNNLKVDSSSVICIEKMPATGSAKLGFSVGQRKLQITVEAPLEHPFFVYKQGWSSCSPERSLLRYRLPCSKLKVGDTCIFLTVKSTSQASKPDLSSGLAANLVPTNQTSNAKASDSTSLGKSQTSASKASVTVPFFQQPSAVASEKRDSSDSAATVPTKRKRRWSAPSEISRETTT